MGQEFKGKKQFMNDINHRAIFILREDRPAVLKNRGDIDSIIPSTQFIGTDVDKSNGAFSIIYVTDLPIALEFELLTGVKRFKVPAGDDPMVVALQSKDNHIGSITVNTETLLDYIEVSP